MIIYGINILVFMSPEVAVRSPWRKIYLTLFFKKHLALVAVDEAHCIPEWFEYFHAHVALISISDMHAGVLTSEHHSRV